MEQNRMTVEAAMDATGLTQSELLKMAFNGVLSYADQDNDGIYRFDGDEIELYVKRSEVTE